MRKIRLGDLNIYSPKRAADWRVSVNLEVPGAFGKVFGFWVVLISVVGCVVQHPLGSPTHTRRKDRMSYAHEEFVIDLTQVTSTMSPNAPVRFPFL